MYVECDQISNIQFMNIFLQLRHRFDCWIPQDDDRLMHSSFNTIMKQTERQAEVQVLKMILIFLNHLVITINVIQRVF